LHPNEDLKLLTVPHRQQIDMKLFYSKCYPKPRASTGISAGVAGGAGNTRAGTAVANPNTPKDEAAAEQEMQQMALRATQINTAQ
jgi:hypothetical protein